MALEGIQLGYYQLVRLIGSGGMGEVYLAEDTRISRQVAIKVVHNDATPYPSVQLTQDTARLFVREMKAIVKLDHPHILPLFDFGQESIHTNTLMYMVMPYRPEGSLVDWLYQRGNTGPLSPQDVAYIVFQAADALQHAHDHQLIHLDVKPSNFLIRNRTGDLQHPDLLLADFGIAKFTTATATASQSVRGTPVSMAPEQWNGQPVPATDQYALAIMAYQLLTGRPPFIGRMEQVMRHHFMTQPPTPSTLNPNLSVGIDTVILRALAKKPEERFPSIVDFAQAFQHTVQTRGDPYAPGMSIDEETTLRIHSSPLNPFVPAPHPAIVMPLMPNIPPTIPAPVPNILPTIPVPTSNAPHTETSRQTSASLKRNIPPVNTTDSINRRRGKRSRVKTLLLTIMTIILISSSAIGLMTYQNYVKQTAVSAQATANANDATASTNATASAIAANPYPSYLDGSGILALYDPLRQSAQWPVYSASSVWWYM